MSGISGVVTVVSGVVAIVAAGIAPVVRWFLSAQSVPDARLERAKKYQEERERVAIYLEHVGEGDEAKRQRESGKIRLARALVQNDESREMTGRSRLCVALVAYAAFALAVTCFVVGFLAHLRVLELAGAISLAFCGVFLAAWGVMSARAETGITHQAVERARGLSNV